MVFDGAFHVPSWLRQLSVHPIDLIVHCRREEGGNFGSPSEAAIALAEWLLADAVRAEREARRVGSPLSMGGVINRLLAGSILPSDQLAGAIGIMTEGAVVPAMFGREAKDVPSETALASLDTAISTSSTATRDEREQDTVLGEIASGPLWAAKRNGKTIEVSGGFGILMRMSEAAGAQLRDSLTAVLPPPGRASAASGMAA